MVGASHHKAGGVHPLRRLPRPLANQASLEEVEVVASLEKEVAVRLLMITLIMDTGLGQVVQVVG